MIAGKTHGHILLGPRPMSRKSTSLMVAGRVGMRDRKSFFYDNLGLETPRWFSSVFSQSGENPTESEEERGSS